MRVEVWVYQHASASMPKRMRCWRPEESAYERAQYSIVTRTSIPELLKMHGTLLKPVRCPCLTCTVKITQVGITEVVYSQGYNMDNDVCPLLSTLCHFADQIRALLF